MKISKRRVETKNGTKVYWVPLFTCYHLKKELVKDGLNIEEINLRAYETVTAKFDISTVLKVTLNCFPDNRPIKNPENRVLFCEPCVNDKELYLEVTYREIKGKKLNKTVFRLVSGSQGLEFK